MKMVIHDAHSLSSTLKRYNINIDIMLDIAKTHQKESYQVPCSLASSSKTTGETSSPT